MEHLVFVEWTSVWRGVRWLLAAAAVIGVLGVPGYRAAAQSAEDPPEYQTASETSSPEELEYWLSIFECPELDGVTAGEPNGYADGGRVGIGCGYDDADGRWVGNFRFDFDKPGAEVDIYCGYTIGDLGQSYRAADPLLSASVEHDLGDFPELRAQATAAVDEFFETFVRPRAAECPPSDEPDCPPVDGWVREGFFGPSDKPYEFISNEGNDFAECAYVEPDATATSPTELTEVTFQVTAFKDGAPDPADIRRACSVADRFDRGQGQLGTGGAQAIRAQYSTNSAVPIDLTAFTDAAQTMIGTLSASAASCDGVELLPADPFTPLPAFYASVFDEDASATPAPAIVAEPSAPGATGTEAGAADTGATDAEATTEPPQGTPAPTDTATNTDTDDSTTESTTAAAAGDTTPPTSAAAATPAESAPSTGSATSSGSDWAWLFTTITIVGLALSVLMLGVTFWLIRKSSRVRPRWDLVRIAISVVVAVALIIVFSKTAPPWAIVAAIVLGAGLGYWQGHHLIVQLTERGLFAKRGAWAIAAFTIGLVITQLARLLDRTGALTLGIALTFFSAALAAGIYIGRRPQIAEARTKGNAAALASIVAIVALVGLAFAAPVNQRADAGAPVPAQTSDDDSPDPAITEALTEFIDWSTVTIEGGLFTQTGKPLATLEVPEGLTEPPAPLTRTVAWDDQVNNATSYSLTETFTFALRADGVCCSVDYTATGEKVQQGTTTPINFEGSLDDIGLVAAEGVGITSVDGNYVDGLPFTEVQPLRVASGVDCHRSIAETRNFDALQESGGEGEARVNETGGLTTPSLELRLGTPCELPGFDLDFALDLAPEPPPTDDPARQFGTVGNCPVVQEVVEQVSAASAFEGVSTHTLGQVMFDGNANACEFGTLFEGPAVGQGGPGGERHEFAIDLAQPRAGEWDRGYDRWWPD
ncbi:MAG: hypothetical protein AAFY28_14810, partial [Actinomycetota bacterium]